MIGALIGLLIGVQAGWWAKRVLIELATLADKLRQPKSDPGVTHTDPRFTNEYAPTNSHSAIVEPKTPQLIQWEEEQELRRRNGM